MSGPTPSVSSTQNPLEPAAAPGVVCNAQRDPAVDGWTLDVHGDGFAPLPNGTLRDAPGVYMPAVTVSNGTTSFTVPETRVQFADRTRLSVRMPTRDSSAEAFELAPGDYQMTVVNPDQNASAAVPGLTVVPPPHITNVSLAPTAGGAAGTTICADQAMTLTVTGSNFRGNAVVTVGAHSFAPSAVTATTATVNIPAGTFSPAETSAAGAVTQIMVKNPEGCVAPAAPDNAALAQVRAFPSCKVLGALTVSPHFGYFLSNTPVTITNQFQAPATQGFSGALPKVYIVAPLAAGGPAQQIPLRSIAYVNPNTITAAIPVCSGTGFGVTSGTAAGDCPGIAPGGPYDLLVIDPVSGTGTVAGQFSVVSNPPPVISALSLPSITTTGAALTVTGQNFDATSKVFLGTPCTAGLCGTATGVLFCPVPVSGTPTATSIAINVGASLGAVGGTSCYIEDAAGKDTPVATGFSLDITQYLVRVQHGADVSNADYAALVVTSTSFNPLDKGVSTSTLNTARGQAGMAIATDDLGQPFLYVAGGSTNGTDQLASVEVAPIGLFGDLGGDCTGAACKFRKLDQTPLPAARAGLQLVARTPGGPVGTSYLYALGGRSGTTAQVDVYRAQVLRNKDAPTMRQISSAAGSGSPGAGTWYYRVAALFPTGDALNPNGAESLPSDEESVVLATGEHATITWGCTAGANKYRVYRNETANEASSHEVFLIELSASCSGTGAGTMSYTDTASATPDASRKPLPRGALGPWVTLGTSALGTARFDFQARVVPGATQDIVAVGGCTQGGASGACTASTGVIEKLSFGAGTDLSPSSVAAAGSGLTARDRFGMSIATANTANVATGKSFLLVFGGETNGTEISGSSTVQGADVGDLVFSNLTGAPQNIGVGGWGDVIANQAFTEATRTNNHSLFSKSGSLGSTTLSSSSSFNLSLNAGVPPYTAGGTRFLPGEELFRAFVYVVGGFAADNAFTPTNTVELFVY